MKPEGVARPGPEGLACLSLPAEVALALAEDVCLYCQAEDACLCCCMWRSEQL